MDVHTNTLNAPGSPGSDLVCAGLSSQVMLQTQLLNLTPEFLEGVSA